MKRQETKRKRLVDVSDLITVTEAGRLGRVSRDTMRRMIERRLLRIEKIDRYVFVYRSEVLTVHISNQAQVRKMSDEELLEAVLVVARALGHVPTSAEYSKRGRIHLSTLRWRFGNWPKVHRAALRKFLSKSGKTSRASRARLEVPSDRTTVTPTAKKRNTPRWIDVNDLIAKDNAARLRKVTRQALNYLIRKGWLHNVLICGKPFVFQSEVMALKFRKSKSQIV